MGGLELFNSQVMMLNITNKYLKFFCHIYLEIEIRAPLIGSRVKDAPFDKNTQEDAREYLLN